MPGSRQLGDQLAARGAPLQDRKRHIQRNRRVEAGSKERQRAIRAAAHPRSDPAAASLPASRAHRSRPTVAVPASTSFRLCSSKKPGRSAGSKRSWSQRAGGLRIGQRQSEDRSRMRLARRHVSSWLTEGLARRGVVQANGQRRQLGALGRQSIPGTSSDPTAVRTRHASTMN